MIIYIPTFNRVGNQRTLYRFPDEWIKKGVVQLVCTPEEIAGHERDMRDRKRPSPRIVTVPLSASQAGPKRQWIIEHSGDRFTFLVDDDLSFKVRDTETDCNHMHNAGPEEVAVMFRVLERWLKSDGFKHVGVSCYNGNNRTAENVVLVTRMINLFGYDLKVFDKHPEVRMDRIQHMEDFDTDLQLLRLGYANAVAYYWAWAETPPGTAGGWSGIRTAETQERSAKRLKELHPDFVRTKVKKVENWRGIPERLDVVMSWKKAFRSSGKPLPPTPNHNFVNK